MTLQVWMPAATLNGHSVSRQPDIVIAVPAKGHQIGVESGLRLSEFHLRACHQEVAGLNPVLKVTTSLLGP